MIKKVVLTDTDVCIIVDLLDSMIDSTREEITAIIKGIDFSNSHDVSQLCFKVSDLADYCILLESAKKRLQM